MRSRAARRAGCVVTPLAAAMVACLALPAAGTAAAEVSEHQVKAVFVYHFTNYLQWPPRPDARSFEIAVLGSSPVLEQLQAIAERRTVGDRPIVIRPLADLATLGEPDILFLAAPARDRLAAALEATRGRPILTVAEEEGLAARGVAVGLVLRGGAVRFEINERALREHGIQASSQILKLAIPPGGEP